MAKCETSRSSCDTNTCIDRRAAAAVLMSYMDAATGTLFSFPFGSLQSWMFASKCNHSLDLPHFFNLFY